jgi:YbbR-like protein
MPGKFGLLFTRNWPIKLVALFLSLMLYVAVAAQQPTTELFRLDLAVEAPGRTLRSRAPTVEVRISGKGSEVLKLHTIPPAIRRVVPDTAGAVWVVRLQPGDVQLPRGVEARVDDIVPREIEILLNAVGRKEVPVVSRVTVAAESGYVLAGGVSLTPAIARLVGPEDQLARIDSVTTAPLQITGVTGAFARQVPIDTSVLGTVRVIPSEVEISGNVGALTERSFAGLPVETGAGALTSFVVVPARVSVAVRGPEAIVSRLTRDSLRVVASLRGRLAAGAYAHLTVVAPRGVTARAVPDSVALQRRTSRRG